MLTSKVKGHEGLCKPIWVNHNQVCNKFDNGVTGFFKLVKKRFGFYLKTGEEFHGIVRSNNIDFSKENNLIVESTNGVDESFDDHYKRSQHADKINTAQQSGSSFRML